MSTHVFENLTVRKNVLLTTSGTLSTSGVDLQLLPGPDQHAVTGLQGSGNARTVQAGLSKTVFLGGTTLAAAAGTNTVPLFNVALTAATWGGLKLFVNLSDAAGVSQRFDEFIGVFQGSTLTAPQLYQVASVCAGTTSGGNLSAVTAGTFTGTNLPFTYSFPYPVADTVGVSGFIEWYGGAAAAFGGPTAALTPASPSGTGGGAAGPTTGGSKYLVQVTSLPSSGVGNGGNYDSNGSPVPTLQNVGINGIYTPAGAVFTGNGTAADFSYVPSVCTAVGDAWTAPKAGTFLTSFSLGLGGIINSGDGDPAADTTGFLAIVGPAWDTKAQIGGGAPVVAVTSLSGNTTACVSGVVGCAAGDKVYFCAQVNALPYGFTSSLGRPEDTLTIAEL